MTLEYTDHVVQDSYSSSVHASHTMETSIYRWRRTKIKYVCVHLCSLVVTSRSRSGYDGFPVCGLDSTVFRLRSEFDGFPVCRLDSTTRPGRVFEDPFA